MAHLTGVPTEALLELLKKEALEEINNFSLIGHKDLGISALDTALNREKMVKKDIEKYIYHSGEISSAFFDTHGVLTFDVMLNADDDFAEYNYAIALVSRDGKLATVAKTPKFILAKGIGGVFHVKVAITGDAGTIIYKNTDYLTLQELKEVHYGTVEDFVQRLA